MLLLIEGLNRLVMRFKQTNTIRRVVESYAYILALYLKCAAGNYLPAIIK